jgi:hypothetical protein
LVELVHPIQEKLVGFPVQEAVSVMLVLTNGAALLVASAQATLPAACAGCQTTLTTEGALAATPLLAVTT